MEVNVDIAGKWQSDSKAICIIGVLLYI